MDSSTKAVVSMLTSNDKITLFTETGELIAIGNEGTYNLPLIVEYLTPRLTGTSSVEIDLSNYLLINSALQNILEVEDDGIVVTQVINGKEIQGIFYPAKSSVTVTVGKEKLEIPEVENLQMHIERAAADGSPSVRNFFKRLAPVIKDRKHSAEDLMKFIKHSEMPLTNDGRIIAYKRVNMAAEGVNVFVDVHSGKVKQQVGSRVTMKVDLVDSNRHQSCSTGLHVANLGYLKGFNGSYTLIVLVNPEDFIAVPHGEYTKARVCGYDVIGVVTDSVHKIVCSGSSVNDDPTFESLIKDAVNCDIKPPFELVYLGDNNNITISRLDGKESAQAKPTSKTTTGKPLVSTAEDAKGKSTATTTDLVKAARAAKSSAEVVEIPKDIQEAFDLIRSGVTKAEVARRFLTSTRSIGRWIEKYGDPMTQINTKTELPNEAEEVSQEDLEAADEWLPDMKAFIAPLTVAQQAREYFDEWKKNKSLADLGVLKTFKAGKKKSWSSLGFTDSEIAQIEKA